MFATPTSITNRPCQMLYTMDQSTIHHTSNVNLEPLYNHGPNMADTVSFAQRVWRSGRVPQFHAFHPLLTHNSTRVV